MSYTYKRRKIKYIYDEFAKYNLTVITHGCFKLTYKKNIISLWCTFVDQTFYTVSGM